MKSLFVILTSFVFSITSQAQEGSCVTSNLLEKAHLSCMSCALQKKKLPIPDDRFLAGLGLVARENVDLLPLLSKSPFRLSLDSDRVQVAKNADGSIYQKNGKEVTVNMENQYHNYVMEMLLASGYCTKDKFKAPFKDEKYTKYDERMKDDKFVTGFNFSDPRTPAAREVGANDWSELSELFFVSKAKAGKLFPKLTYSEQVSEMKKRRNEYLAKSRSAFSSDFNSFTGKTEFYTSCFEELNSSPVSQEQLQNQSRELCNAIYDECGIPRTGDPCEVKYPVVQETTKELPQDNKLNRNDKAPPHDKNSKTVEDRNPPKNVNSAGGINLPYTNTQQIYQSSQDGCWYDSSNKKLNMPCNPPPANLPSTENTKSPPGANK